MYVTVNNRPIQEYVHQDDHTQTYLILMKWLLNLSQ